MEELHNSHPDCVQYLSTIDTSQWTAAYDGGFRFGIMTTNLAESINGVLKGIRQLPITALVADTFKRCVAYFCKRRTEYNVDISKGYRYPRVIRELLDHRSGRANPHQVQMFNRETGLFNVRTGFDVYTRSGNHDHIVQLNDGQCSCGKFQGFHIPCSHAIASCRNAGVDYHRYVKVWYTLEYCQRVYANDFFPLGDVAYWPQYNGRVLEPNDNMLRKLKGRPRSTRIRNEMDWNTGKKSLIICGSCGQTGHNRRTCRNRIR